MITHPEKLRFPDDGITKGELAAYYETIASYMLPHLTGRPITMERYQRGIGAEGFFQKDVTKGFPEWLERVEVPKKGGMVHHPLAGDVKSLLWLANQNTITPHVWTSRAPDLFHPDVCVFDLDPAVDNPHEVRAAALQLRELLRELGLCSWVKTSGSKGFHIAVPLDREAEFDEVEIFADRVGRVLVSRDPSRLTQEFSKADRGGPHSGRHWTKRLQRDVCGCLRGSRKTRRASVSTVYVGGDGTRRRSTATFTLRTMAARTGGPVADMNAHLQSIRVPGSSD